MKYVFSLLVVVVVIGLTHDSRSLSTNFNAETTRLPNYVSVPIPQPIFTSMDMDIIVDIESTGNSHAKSSKGAVGLTQIMEPTWEEVTGRLGVDWLFIDALDPVKNLIVGTYYYNTIIPGYLKYYNIPDSIEARIVAYDWGIGNLNKIYKDHGDSYMYYVPKEASDYVEKYYDRLRRKNKKRN